MKDDKQHITGVVEDSMDETKVPLIFQVFAELAIGILMIVYRDNTTQVIMIVVGSLMVCYGVFDLIAFLTNNRPYSFRRGLASGALITVLGAAFIIQADQLKNILAIVIGAIILFESVVNIRRAFMIRNFGYDKWNLIMIVSFVILALGVIICIYPALFSSAISIIMGIGIILEALVDAMAIALIVIYRKKVSEKYNINPTYRAEFVEIEETEKPKRIERK